MSNLEPVQEKSRSVFQGLLRAESQPSQGEAALAAAPSAAPARFSPFDVEQGPEAAGLALGLAVVAAAAPSPEEGLSQAIRVRAAMVLMIAFGRPAR